MEDFDINIVFGRSIIQITLQSENFKGHIFQTINGVVSGKHAIFESLDFKKDIKLLNERITSDCDFMIYKDEFGVSVFRATLRNDKGDTVRIRNFDLIDIDKFIVGVEIIEYKDCKI